MYKHIPICKTLSTLAIVAVVNIASSVSANTTIPDCELAGSDVDGDGWGWENSSSCIWRNESDNSTSNNKQTYPSCSSTSYDQDGDGWGWENNKTCRIDSTNNQSDNDTSTTSDSDTVQNGHPLCTTTNADSDGDGWGYENGKSCLVVVNTQSDNTGDTTTGSNSKYPDCSSDAVDLDNDGWGYEDGKSCIVIPETGAATGSSDVVPPIGNSTVMDVGVIFDQKFSTDSLGLYQGDQLNNGWNSPLWHLGFDQGRVKIVVDDDTNRDKVMEVTYPAGAYGANGASAFLSEIQFGMDLPESYNELYIAYDIKFDEDFEFVLGGKLPGLCGYDSNQAPSTGCNTGGGIPTGFDGWSTRGMWREDGALENYVYHANQSNFYGDDEHWNAKAIPDTWHRIQHRVILNTVGQKNGVLEAWFDGTKVLSENTMEYRKIDTIGINLFYFSTFFGGNNSTWAPTTDQRVFFDNFVISTRKIP